MFGGENSKVISIFSLSYSDRGQAILGDETIINKGSWIEEGLTDSQKIEFNSFDETAILIMDLIPVNKGDVIKIKKNGESNLNLWYIENISKKTSLDSSKKRIEMNVKIFKE